MLRDYQIELAEKGERILATLHILYLSMEMRVGKTLIALEICKIMHFKRVLFVTKKKAISSIQLDFITENYNFGLKVINYEQVQHYMVDYSNYFDCVIVDEGHSLGAYPKPSQRTINIKAMVKSHYLIILSGTPTPESYSQIYHQLWISDYSPFAIYKNFYKWAHDFASVTAVDERGDRVQIIPKKKIKGMLINDYSKANKDKIMPIIEKYFLTYTREEAGFKQTGIVEEIIYIDIEPRVLLLINWLLKRFYYLFQDGSEIVCDSAVKLQNKIHQLCSGTVKTEKGDFKILDYAKARYIRQHYQGKKIAVYYKFIAEGMALREMLGGSITESPEEFNITNDKIFISQIQSGAMGISLASADILIFYNIDFSAVNYWQARARLSALDRETAPVIHWLFARGGIEEKVMKAVLKKKSYTTYYFQKDYSINQKERMKIV